MKIKRLVISLISTVAVGAAAQSATLHNVYARDITKLNGTWQTIADPFDAGYLDYRLNVSPNGFFKNEKPQSSYDHVEYDFSDKETLKVPGDWNTQCDRLFFYEGSIWYKKDFDYDLKADNRLYVYFGASNYRTDVYLNGEKLGEHIGGYTPHSYEITDKIKSEGNFLVVRVNNVRHPEGVPTVNSDWWNYGGITRDVMLVETPAVSVDDYSVRLPKGEYDKIYISAQLNQPISGKVISVRIPELYIDQRLITDANGYASATVKKKPQLWSPEMPKLYDVAVLCGDEKICDQIGFRHIETRGKELLLNGKPVFLRGICIHEEAPLRTGRCCTEADDSILLSWAKELNCNLLRLAHYPHNEQMVRMAEKKGFMLWSEIPVYWTIHWDNPQTYDNASNQLAENMSRDHNRCAIIIWSVANETPHSNARDKFLAGLAQQVRNADDERLISMAMEVSPSDKPNVSNVHDNMSEYVDIISFNNYLGWYGGRPDDCDTRVFDIPYDKPFFISEFGGGALAGLHGDATQKWTEEYQANLYKHTLDMYNRHEGFAGCAPWILMDFRSARRQNHETQNFFNRKGIVSEKGEKKAAFHVLKDFYKTK